jgi:hypothetical protein
VPSKKPPLENVVAASTNQELSMVASANVFPTTAHAPNAITLPGLLGDLYAAFGEHCQVEHCDEAADEVENGSVMRAARVLGVSGEEAYTPRAPVIIVRTTFSKWYVPVEILNFAIPRPSRQVQQF